MKKKVIVNKFGGGILKKDLIQLIEKRLKDQIRVGYLPVVVVSALPGVTDELLAFAEKLKSAAGASGIIDVFIKALSKKHSDILSEIGCKSHLQQIIVHELVPLFEALKKDLKYFGKTDSSIKSEDKIIAWGEKLSATVFAGYFTGIGLSSTRIMAEEIPIITDDNFKNANIVFEVSAQNLRNRLEGMDQIAVIPGFTGVTEIGDCTTLGRGGTDTTACFVGSALRAEKIILWKDVGGVLSADPRIVDNASTIPFVSYQEAEEAGKIIHEKAIKYVKKAGTSIEIVSLADPEMKTIVGEAPEILQKGAKIVSYRKSLTLFVLTDENLKGNELLAYAGNAMIRNKVDAILISNTRYSLQIVADNSNGMAERVLEELMSKVEKIEMTAVDMVFLVGNFDVNDVNEFNSMLVKLQTDLEISAFLYKNCTRLEAVIGTGSLDRVIKALHKKFIRNK